MKSLKMALTGFVLTSAASLAFAGAPRSVICCDSDGGNCVFSEESGNGRPMTIGSDVTGLQEVVFLKSFSEKSIFGRVTMNYDHIAKNGFVFRLKITEGKIPTGELLTPQGDVYSKLSECRANPRG
jgi:hypothetical protein